MLYVLRNAPLVQIDVVFDVITVPYSVTPKVVIPAFLLEINIIQ